MAASCPGGASSSTETDGFSQLDSAQSVAATTETVVPAFDQALQPYANTLPSQISQHSVFVLPKPAFIAAASAKRNEKGGRRSSAQSSSCCQEETN